MKANIFDALQFATNAHSGQFRKGTKIPYIVHPVTVMQTLIEYGASDDAVMAGILHDTLGDTPTTVADLEQNFGKRITQLVIGASEMDKSLSWEERKEHTLDTLGKCDDLDLLMVTCADKFSNIRSIIADHKKFGDDVWTRFNRGYDLQKWYYGGLAQIFVQHIDKSRLFADYADAVQQIFGK